MVEALATEMGEFFPELRKQQQLITNVIEEEEKSFLRTLASGIARFEDYAGKNKGKNIDGFFAFELYDTFGFPIDLTQLLARELNVSVDMESFNQHLKEQKDRSQLNLSATHILSVTPTLCVIAESKLKGKNPTSWFLTKHLSMQKAADRLATPEY